MAPRPSPTAPVDGDEVQVSATITNNGYQTSGAFFAGLYFIGADDSRTLIEEFTVNDITAGASSTAVFILFF